MKSIPLLLIKLALHVAEKILSLILSILTIWKRIGFFLKKLLPKKKPKELNELVTMRAPINCEACPSPSHYVNLILAKSAVRNSFTFAAKCRRFFRSIPVYQRDSEQPTKLIRLGSIIKIRSEKSSIIASVKLSKKEAKQLRKMPELNLLPQWNYKKETSGKRYPSFLKYAVLDFGIQGKSSATCNEEPKTPPSPLSDWVSKYRDHALNSGNSFVKLVKAHMEKTGDDYTAAWAKTKSTEIDLFNNLFH